MKAALLGVAAAAVALCLSLALEGRRGGAPIQAGAGTAGHAKGAAESWGLGEAEAGEETWGIFRAGGGMARTAEGEWAERYRLAGVFRTLGGEDDGEGEYFAILDERSGGKQHLLGRGESLGGEVWVKEVGVEHVVLTDGRREEALFIAAGAAKSADGAGGGADESWAEEGWTVTTNRFGTRTGETRWSVRREAVLEYAQELMDNPERMVGLFNALEPDWGKDESIEGYRVNPERGEAEFFQEVGLEAGDVVRRVNSMHMTSQRRAEHFIREFMVGNLGAVVLDIERNGKAEKLIYLVE